jgi:hypothetical protein
MYVPIVETPRWCAAAQTEYKGRRMHPSMRRHLQEIFRDSTQRLHAMLGRDLGWQDVEAAG